MADMHGSGGMHGAGGMHGSGGGALASPPTGAPMRTLTADTLALRAHGRDLARQDAALDASDPLRVPRTARGLAGWLDGNDPELTELCASPRRRTTIEAAYRRQVAGAVR